MDPGPEHHKGNTTETVKADFNFKTLQKYRVTALEGLRGVFEDLVFKVIKKSCTPPSSANPTKI